MTVSVNSSQLNTRTAQMRAAAILAAPVVLAFTVPPFGFLASLVLPILAARVCARLWSGISPAFGGLYAVLALTGLWLPAALALASSGRIGSESAVWLVIPLCAPSGAALLVPATVAILTYVTGLICSLISSRPWPWVVGAWAAPVAYGAAASWLVDFSCVA